MENSCERSGTDNKIQFMKWLLPLILAMSAVCTLNALTIQERVNQASPGDIVEIPGGVYFETVRFPRGGEPGKPIVLRAESGQTVVINAGQLLEVNLEPVPGYPGMYSGEIGEGTLDEGSGLWEVASRIRMRQVGSREECARRLASWYYDSESGHVYLRSSGNQPADQLQYWIEAADKPVIHVKYSHIEIDGFHLTLGEYGVLIDGNDTNHVTVKNNRAYANKKSGIHIRGSHHKILDNEVFHNNHHGIQLRYEVQHSRVLRNYCYSNGPANGEGTDVPEPVDLSLYSRSAYNLIADNIADGFTKNAYRNKYGENQTNLFTRNVVRGNINPGKHAVFGNTFLTSFPGPRAGMYLKSADLTQDIDAVWQKADPGALQRTANLIYPAWHQEDPLFVDPVWMDFRLQANSPYLGRGGFPGLLPVYFVDPINGDLQNDGLSEATAIRSLSHLLGVADTESSIYPVAGAREDSGIAPAGATLYLKDGVYSDPVVVYMGKDMEGNPLRIRAHGKSPHVKVTGPWTIQGNIGVKVELSVSTGAEGVVIEGLHFLNTRIVVQDAREITFRHCIFEQSELVIEGSDGVKLDRNTFIGASVRVNDSEKIALTNNLGTHEKWLETDEKSEVYMGWNVVNPEIEFGAHFSLLPDAPEKNAAADFGFVGARGEKRESLLQIEGLEVTGVSPHGATLRWESPRQATFAEVRLREKGGEVLRRMSPSLEFQIMGEFFDMSFLNEAFFGVDRSMSLGVLKPGTEYEVELTAVDLHGNRGQVHQIRFTTPTQSQPGQTWYVSSEGDDRQDGRTAQSAWKSFHHATAQLQPGDELVILPGTYYEILRPSVSGTRKQPIVIRAAEPGTVILDLQESMPLGLEVLNVDHVHVEGLLFAGGKYSVGFNMLVSQARGIQIRGCEVEWPSGSDFVNIKAGHNGIVVHQAPELLLEDNMFLCNTIGIGLSASPGAVVRHNTILGRGNYGVVIVPGSADDVYQVYGNLFDRVIMDYKAGPNLWMFAPGATLESDYNLFHIPADHRATLGQLPHTERIQTLEEWQQVTGLDRHSILAEPQFADPMKRDFRLLEGSPGKGMMPDGSDVGRRVVD